MICPRSFEIRRPLEAVCGLGYTVTESPLNTYWATDLLHRIFHVPKISEDVVGHYAEDYEGVLELTETHSNSSVFDSDTLQYFAIDVYAFDIAAPGVGCHGEDPEHNHATSTSMAAPTATYTSMAAPTTTPVATVAATSSYTSMAAPAVTPVAATSSATTPEQASGTTTAPAVRNGTTLLSVIDRLMNDRNATLTQMVWSTAPRRIWSRRSLSDAEGNEGTNFKSSRHVPDQYFGHVKPEHTSLQSM